MSGIAEYGSFRRSTTRAGFSLVELLIVMAIFLILAGVAVPSLQSISRASRIANGTHAFVGDLRLARMEAIRRNRSVEVEQTGATTYTIEYIGARTLSDGVTFSSGPALVRFAPFGPLQTGLATYTLNLDGDIRTVRLSASGNAVVE
jgi:prepilin-type N-terminal cleavage/methylation domain-containing protein